MCGIFGYLNYRQPKSLRKIINILINGIRRMEYRGYDSAGLAIDGSNQLLNEILEMVICKEVGKVVMLENKINEILDNRKFNLDENEEKYIHFGIAHTRWATHGIPCELNSHPQTSDDLNHFVVVHNGIITNYREIKTFLAENGYHQKSQTDTEIIVILLKFFYDKTKKQGESITFVSLASLLLSRIQGAYAIVIKSNLYPNECICAKRGSPLIIGIKTPEINHFKAAMSTTINSSKLNDKNQNDSEYFIDNDLININSPIEYIIASDACAIIEHTNHVIYLGEDSVAHINDVGKMKMYNVKEKQTDFVENFSFDLNYLDMKLNEIMKGSFDTYMEKEIFEQPESVLNTLRGRIDTEEMIPKLSGIMKYDKILKRSKRIIFIACGTSFHSAVAMRQLFEEMTDLPIIVEMAGDFLDRNVPIFRDDACVFISQSGETADTLSALKYCKKNMALLIGITNVVGSTISRETNCGIHLNAGPEIGVASTKAYTSQIVALTLLACHLGADSISKRDKIRSVMNLLLNMDKVILESLTCYDEIKLLAKELYTANSILIIGRGFHKATILEASLKIKELTYIHAEGIHAGELKHGSLALVDETVPLIFVVAKDENYLRTLNSLEQILSRNCSPIVICDKKCEIEDVRIKKVIKIPSVNADCQVIPFIIPFQLLSLQIAILKGNNVDFPRNLAKSVTVE